MGRVFLHRLTRMLPFVEVKIVLVHRLLGPVLAITVINVDQSVPHQC